MERLIKYQEQIENINNQNNMLIRTVDTLFDDIKSNLTKVVIFDEPVTVMESGEFDNQYYAITIFGIEKSGLIGTYDDVTHLTLDDINEQDITVPKFDYTTLQDKIYLLQHIIFNLKED